MPELSHIEGFLAHFNKREIEFLFCTDRIDLGQPAKKKVADSLLFVSNDFELEGEFVFPFSIRA